VRRGIASVATDRVPPVNRPLVYSTPPARCSTIAGMIDALLRIGPDKLVLAAMAGAALVLWTGRR
jgi:hypothetical protein